MRKVHASKKCWSVAQKYPIDKCTSCFKWLLLTNGQLCESQRGETEVVQKVSKLLNDKIEPFQQAPDKQLEIVFIVTIVFKRDVIFGLINS